MKSHIAIAFLLAVIGAASSQSAGRCDPNVCRLPRCYCGGTEVPGGLSRKSIPQFVLLTFDDAVNSLNQQFFKDLFNNRRNPNGCPIKVCWRKPCKSQMGTISVPRTNHC